ncbi:MAG: porin [Rubrivivax sp.]|nr:porin [Rubrivivax sp.]
MNKILKHAALGTVALAACGAQAQSSVTVAGMADAAVRSVSNQGVGSVKSLVSGSNSTSRIIIRGVEDLGGGMSASFWLEHGLALDTGAAAQATQFWDRRSTVSLSGKSWGEVRAGRDFVPTYVGWSRFDPFGHIGAAGSNNFATATPNGPIRSAFGTNPNTTVRANNALQYFLPAGLGGLEGSLMLAAGEGGAVASGLTKVTGLRLGWAGGGYGLSVATATSENSLTTAGKFKDTAIGGNATLGSLRLTAAWRKFEQNAAEQTNVMVGAIYSMGQSDIKFSYLKANMAGRVGTTVIDANDATQMGLGYIYNLSKRSALYTHYARISNKGAATFVVPGGPAGIGGGKTSTGYEAGLRHTF